MNKRAETWFSSSDVGRWVFCKYGLGVEQQYKDLKSDGE